MMRIDMNHLTMVQLGDVSKFLQDVPNGLLLDVLTIEQHEQQHIPGSRQACVFETAFLDNMSKLAPDRNMPVLAYGAGHSLDAAVAGAKLMGAGYKDVRIFAGGLEAWQAAQLPLGGSASNARLEPFPPQTPAACDYALIPEESVLRWTGRNDKESHWGSLNLKSGELHFIGSDVTGGAIADMASIANDDLEDSSLRKTLLDHLASEDFFHSILFPEATMEVLELKMLPDANSALPNYAMKARLALRGHEQVVAGLVSLRNLDDNKLSLAGQIDLDRTRWGVLYGSARFFRFLGMHKVDDLITLDARLIFKAF